MFASKTNLVDRMVGVLGGSGGGAPRRQRKSRKKEKKNGNLKMKIYS